MMDLMIARCGLNEPLYWLIGVIFGYQWVVFVDLSANQYLHSKGGFRLRLWADEEHSMPYDKLPTLTEEEKEAEQEWWASLKQRELIEAENPSFNLQACLPDIKEDDSQRINLFRVQDAHDLNVRLVLLFVGNFYLDEDEEEIEENENKNVVADGGDEQTEWAGIKFVDENERWDPAGCWFWSSWMFASAVRSYGRYHQRHWIHSKKILKSENEEDDDDAEVGKIDWYFHENGAIHYILSYFIWMDLDMLLRTLRGGMQCYLLYLSKMCMWSDVFAPNIRQQPSEYNEKFGSWHTDASERIHGLSSQLMRIKMTLSDENLENYVLWTKNGLVKQLGYLEAEYPAVYEMIFDIVMNLNLSGLMASAASKKKQIADEKIGYVLKALSTATDKIAVDRMKKNVNDKEENEEEEQPKAGFNYKKRAPRSKRTKSARMSEAAQQKRDNMIRKERAAAQRKARRKKVDEKKKKWRVKRVIYECGVDEVKKLYKNSGYDKKISDCWSYEEEEELKMNEDGDLMDEMAVLDEMNEMIDD